MRPLQSMRSKWVLSAVAVLAVATPAAHSEEGWLFTTVDSGPNSHGYTNLAILPSGHPAISYVETISDGGDPYWDLKYAWFNGSTWNITAVGGGERWSTHTSMVILPSGYPAISYYDYVNGDLKYAWFDGSEWQFSIVDSDGNVGEYNSIAVLQSDYPAISYRDADAPALKYAWFDGGEWHPDVVADGPADYTNLAILDSGRPAISYRGNDYPQNLKYAWFDGSEWQTTTADPEAQTGLYTSLAILPSGYPAVSYCRFAYANNALKYAWFDGSDWHAETVDSGDGAGHWNSLTILPSGQPAISYAGLKYAWRDDGENWHIETVDATGGTQTSMVVLPSDLPAISYGNGGDLMYAARCAFPLITEQPEGAERCQGDSVTFTVVAEADPPLDYQWRKDGEDIPGATDDSFNIASVTLDDAGVYDVVVTNPCGSTTSDPAVLAVADAEPDISEHPQSQIACVGDSVTFSVAAAPEPLSYQWYQKGAGPIGGATEASYTIDPVSASDGRGYHVVVTNPCGSAASHPALLTVVESAPSILEHPQSQTVCEGDPVTFCVTIDGGNLSYESYQWRKDGEDIPGATRDCYTIDPVSVDDAGMYDVVVTNACGVVPSDAATLTVADEPPSIEQNPDSQDKCVGDPVTFSVTASSPGSLEYQWRKDGADLEDDGRISGATTPTLTINALLVEDQGSYDVVVTNVCDSVTSAAATLTVADEGPNIEGDPEDQDECVGESATFSVTASGPEPLEYQWRKDGNDLTDDGRITGATTATLTINPALPEDTGLYDVVVTNRCATATSEAATLDIDAKPRVTVQPVSVTIVEGQQHLFCIVASGAEPLTYQWQKDGADIEDANVDCYLASEVGTYRCVVTNHCGSTASDNATLTTVPALSATASTPTPAIKAGDSARLTATPSGGLAPYSYSWSTQQSGRSITVTPAESTVYTVTVSDSQQQTAVAEVSVTVVSPMIVTARASAYTLAPGESSILTAVIASGGWAPFRYSWSTGETEASITVSPTQETTYSVTVTDSLDQTGDAIVTIAIHDATAPPPEQPSDEDETDQSEEDVPPDDGEPPPSDTNETEEPTEEAEQDVPPVTPGGLCPAVGLITIGLTLLGLWRTKPATRRGRHRRG